MYAEKKLLDILNVILAGKHFVTIAKKLKLLNIIMEFTSAGAATVFIAESVTLNSYQAVMQSMRHTARYSHSGTKQRDGVPISPNESKRLNLRWQVCRYNGWRLTRLASWSGRNAGYIS